MMLSKHIRIYIYLCEPQFSTVVPHVAFIYRIRLHELVSLNVFMFREFFLEMRKFCQPLDNFGEKNKRTLFG
jgi:hypothetical protein